MKIFKDALRMLPNAALAVSAITLASYASFTISRDLATDKAVEHRAEDSRESFEELYENYDEYVVNIAECLKGCNESRDIICDFAFYLTMLDYGYISYGTDFVGGEYPIEVPDQLGATVVTGHGVCRHAADNLVDVLKALGYDAKMVVGKYYRVGESRPDDVNHAVVYVEQDGIGYLLDPINGTIFLKKSGLVYYDIHSQEETYICFEPTLTNHVYNDDDGNNLNLLLDLGNDFKNHWDILKTFNEYKDASNKYIGYFCIYEQQHLVEHEKAIDDIFDDLVIEYGDLSQEESEEVIKGR